MSITALFVARRPTGRRWAGLDVAELTGRVLANAADVQAAWFDAIALVRTPYFFFIDDTDELPENYRGVLDLCATSGADVAYTDELVRDAQGGERLSRGGPYSQAEHMRNPLLLHHLVLCRTDAALAALQRLPRGHYWPEMLLYWEMAKRGAAHIPAIGYIWNKADTGLHLQPFTTMAMVRSQLWCKDHPEAH